jgi:predicted nuclease of predicted toxin-antitoxin system
MVVCKIHPALARRIESLGHNAEHVADRKLEQAPDQEIRDYAAKNGAVIITKDEDFAVHRILHEGPAVVWVRIGNTRRVEPRCPYCLDS